MKQFLSLLLSVTCLCMSASMLVAAEKDNNHLYASSLTFQVEPRDETCFFEELTANQPFKIEYEVIRGGLLDIKCKIYGTRNNVEVDKLSFFNRPEEALNENEGKLTYTPSDTGVHRICFDNTMSRWTAKVITFFILHDKNPALKHTEANQQVKDAAKLEHLGPVVDSIIKLADTLDDIENLQHQMRVREQFHRDSTENTNSRVQHLAIVEGLAVILLTAAQVKMIRSWFQDNVKYGRV